MVSSSRGTTDMADVKAENLDWVYVQDDENDTIETGWQKLKRKTLENPLVPIGTLATTAALTVGLINFQRGNKQMQQHMMRARVAAQMFTIICVVTGFILIPKSK